jgi:MOSC domain-containing protein YiiM
VNTPGRIHSISTSKTKGDKKYNVEQARLIDNFGIEGDAHAGTVRQVSLLPFESFSKVANDIIDINPGDFAENLTIEGMNFSGAVIGGRIGIGDNIELEIVQIGKECHDDCRIKEITGDCIMPREGIFTRVICGGDIKIGDSIYWK